jgi:hypothetical protein
MQQSFKTLKKIMVQGFCLLPFAFLLSRGGTSMGAEGLPEHIVQQNSPISRPTCPQEFQPLVQRLLLDLPSYTNRVSTRLDISYSYLLVAGKPEFEPLPLSPIPLSPATPTLPGAQPQQVFFTTLVRRYESWLAEQQHRQGFSPSQKPISNPRTQIREYQEYHWLFLVPSEQGWRFVMLFSIQGSYPQIDPPLPPKDASQGKLAMAIRAWLRDCRTGTVPQS